MKPRSLAQLLCLSLGLLAMPAPVPAADPPHRPNIVFIFADDHAWQAISAYGDSRKLLDTPNIDRIGREGMRFDRCLVTNSICGPSRATLLTGKYSHANGFYNNTNSKFDGTQTTFPKLLQKAGYQTAVFGKWHLVSNPTGFDHWHILPGQGVYYNPPMKLGGTGLPPNGKPTKHSGYVSDILTDLSLDWLQKRDKDKPFLLMLHHKAPHREWSPALRHLGHDKDRQYPLPDTLFDDYTGRGKAEREQDMTIAKTMNELDLKLTPPKQLNAEQRKTWDAYYNPRNEAFRQAKLQGKDLVRWKYNRYLHDYLGCIKAVDESVGRVLKYLDDEGLAKDTLVVYSSDQGFYLGEHGWFDKRWIFEESLRTALLARWPGVVNSGSVNKNMVSILDLAETFLDVSGQVIPANMQGRSLVPLLKGQTPADWRKSLYYHYYEHPGPHKVHRHYGVVTPRYKLIYFYEPDANYWELFDLQKDPKEMRSVYDQSDYAAVQTELHAELSRLRKELKVPDPDPKETEIKPPKRKRP